MTRISHFSIRSRICRQSQHEQIACIERSVKHGAWLMDKTCWAWTEPLTDNMAEYRVATDYRTKTLNAMRNKRSKCVAFLQPFQTLPEHCVDLLIIDIKYTVLSRNGRKWEIHLGRMLGMLQTETNSCDSCDERLQTYWGNTQTIRSSDRSEHGYALKVDTEFLRQVMNQMQSRADVASFYHCIEPWTSRRVHIGTSHKLWSKIFPPHNFNIPPQWNPNIRLPWELASHKGW